MKAIETQYNGYRFRSRLEARWAVFFDALGVKYEYEPEGYETEAGWYLPDFWLPEWGCFVEIKPSVPDVGKFDKFISLAEGKQDPDKSKNRKQHYVLCGTPGRVSFTVSFANNSLENSPIITVGSNSYVAMSYSGLNRISNGSPDMTVCSFAMTDGGRTLDIWPIYIPIEKNHIYFDGFRLNLQAKDIRKNNGALASISLMGNFLTQRIYVGRGIIYNHWRLIEAYTAARSARFEHGEKGYTP